MIAPPRLMPETFPENDDPCAVSHWFKLQGFSLFQALVDPPTEFCNGFHAGHMRR